MTGSLLDFLVSFQCMLKSKAGFLNVNQNLILKRFLILSIRGYRIIKMSCVSNSYRDSFGTFILCIIIAKLVTLVAQNTEIKPKHDNHVYL